VSGAVDSFSKDGVLSGGREHGLDVVIFATGFEAFDIYNQLDLVGVEGLTSLNPKQLLVDEFTREVEERFSHTAHSKSCASWWSE